MWDRHGPRHASQVLNSLCLLELACMVWRFEVQEPPLNVPALLSLLSALAFHGRH